MPKPPPPQPESATTTTTTNTSDKLLLVLAVVVVLDLKMVVMEVSGTLLPATWCATEYVCMHAYFFPGRPPVPGKETIQHDQASVRL